MRNLFYAIATILVLALAVWAYFMPGVWWSFIVVGPLVLIGIWDVLQPSHTILRNFPVIGHFRYMFEFISPEIQQYFIERNTDGRPFSRNQRALVYKRGKNVNDTSPFGTQLDLYSLEYEGLRHSMFPAHIEEESPRVKIGGDRCKNPYEASILNVSAMSYGSLSSRAIEALSIGASRGNYYVNTGEGGLCDYHLNGGGDVVWQIGTGYFGCRTKDGEFDPDMFAEKAQHVNVKMIELKLSQGAKPGHGGVLPAVKNTREIAKIRGLEPHTTVISPPFHRAFSSNEGLLKFIGRLRELSGGKPVGFKLCIGKTEEFTELCELMRDTGMLPDFITIDGAEGGTGAAPMEFSDSVGMPIQPALMFASRTLREYGIKDQIPIIASGKVLTAASLLKMIALGADLCNSARAFMFSVGCIQALRCNTNECPTGVATQDPMLVRGLHVKEKSERAYHFHRRTVNAAVELMAACGVSKIEEVNIDMFVRGDEFVKTANQYFPDSFTSFN